jgi:hypothetical protein
MAKYQNLTEHLGIGKFSDDELATVLTSVLPRGAQFRPDQVEYRTMADEWVLTLHYRDGAITKASAGAAFTPAHLQQIRAEIKRALASAPGMRVARWTMFCTRPVTGTWRYRDKFQIVPPPPEAPHPNELIAQHPFLVDFVFSDSPLASIQQMRRGRQALLLMLLLDLFLRQRVSAPTNRGRKHWVWAPHGSKPPVVWAGEGYMIPNLQYLVDGLPTVKHPPIEDMRAEDYYDLIKGYSDTLTIPSELGDLFDRFFALEKDDRDRFLRATYWYHTASTVWDYSQSLHLAGLINAIESLSSVGPQRSTPQGPSLLFREFMRKFAPLKSAQTAIRPGPSALFTSVMKKFAPGPPSRRMIDDIYDARSKITHGERLLYYDGPPGAWALSQVSTSDRETSDAAVLLCRGALINWLWCQAPDGGTGQLVTRGLRVEKPARPGTKSGATIIVPNQDGD